MPSHSLVKTLGELKQSGYKHRSVKEEMRENLLSLLREKRPVFNGMQGYDSTVLQQLKIAVLGQHDVLLLGQRGQGKTRLLRSLIELLDETIPIIAGSEVNDNPFAPISKFGRELLKESGDDCPIEWISRKERYGEKLATPDVTVADIIGDIDPMKAMNEKLHLGHESSIHFGIIPRCNRGIFAINELPDLQARIQVSLLNILEERDFQIRGFKVRMPLDIMLTFSANPEDYTNRGNIITPLKDRIDTQILTHYPKTRIISKKITDQEAWTQRGEHSVFIAKPIRNALEQIAFEARKDKDYIDQSSGVSVRLSVTALETLISAIEYRSELQSHGHYSAYLNDLHQVIPAITGKLELVYEGEQEGASKVAEAMIHKAIKSVFDECYVDPYNRRDSDPEKNPYFPIIHWFESGGDLTLNTSESPKNYWIQILTVPEIEEVMNKCLKSEHKKLLSDKVMDKIVLAELLLEGLFLHSRISKEILSTGFRYKDMMTGIMES